MKITVLEPDEQIDAFNVSTGKQHINKLSVLKGGVWAPITFDVLDSIGCHGINSHRAIVTDDYTDNGYTVDHCSFFATTASPTLLSDSPDGMSVLVSDDDIKVKYHSSISQFKNTLSVSECGEWVPLSYDVLDYIGCDRVKSHRAVVTDGDDIGYQFDVAEQVCYTDKYVYHDRDTVELRELPHWFGEGYYEAHVHEAALVNSDDESLGNRGKRITRIGLSYALATETLEPDD